MRIPRLKSGWFKYLIWPVLFVSGLIILYPSPAYAMHIAEGILPASWCVVWYVLAFIFVGLGIHLTQKRIRCFRGNLPFYGLVGAAIFLISLFPIPVPVSGTSSHPTGTPLGAILVGPFASIVLGAIALLFQALFLAHGGISTWGANIVSMGIVGSLVGFGVFFLARKLNTNVFVAAFLAGILGDWATYAMTSFELAAALHGSGTIWNMFQIIGLAFAPTQLPLGILEGLFTGGVVVLIQHRRPDLLGHLIPLRHAVSSEEGEDG